jgi:hypothetical protein
LLLFLVAVLAAFCIGYTGAGRSVRSSLLPDPGIILKVWILVKALIKLFMIHIPGKLPALFLLLAPFFYLGSQYDGRINIRRAVKKSALAFIVLCVVSLLPVVYVMAEMGPERAWSQISLYLTFFMAFLLFITGRYYKLRFNALKTIKIFGGLSAAWVFATGLSAVATAFSYSRAWENRMHYVERMIKAGNNEVIYVKPLPPAGWLHSAEITTDPGHFTNIHFRQYMETENPIILETAIEK